MFNLYRGKISALGVLVLIVFLFSCNNGFDPTKLQGGYHMQFEANPKDQNEDGMIKQLFNRTVNAFDLEISFDGKGTAVNHFGNDVLGVGARLFGIDSKNIHSYTFKYEIQNDFIYHRC